MADIVFDADAVGQVITYVAPGFLARTGYRARYPAPDRPAGEVLIISVVTSLPLVALVGLLPGQQDATQLGYVALLLTLGFILGYLVALVRGQGLTKKALAKLGYRLQPDGTIYAQTLQHMAADGSVVVELKDGRRVWGCPRSGPQSKDDGVTELYLVYPKSQTDEGAWTEVGAGLIVPLAEVSTISLSEDPTGAPRE